MKTLRSIFSFYKSFAFVSTLITLVSVFIVYINGSAGVSMIQPFFWFKLFTLGAIFYFTNSYKKNEYYYYRNLGISKLILWVPTLAFDITLFSIAIITTAIHNYEALS